MNRRGFFKLLGMALLSPLAKYLPANHTADMLTADDYIDKMILLSTPWPNDDIDVMRYWFQYPHENWLKKNESLTPNYERYKELLEEINERT